MNNYIHTTFHVPVSGFNGSLEIKIKTKILIQSEAIFLSSKRIYFEYLLSYIISGPCIK